MLVLSRKNTEQIRIGDDITVTVLRVQGNKIRIGIEAPENVRVLRGELPRHEEIVDAVPPSPGRTPGRLSGRAAAIVANMMANSIPSASKDALVS
jgi:carbon storage regulator